jgi:putative aldouronate transport system permease protein
LGFERSPWVGLKNFRFLMLLPQFKELLRNTLVLAVSKLVVLQITAIILALLLNEIRVRVFKRIVNQVLYLPYFLSWVVLAGILLDMMASNGMIGRALNSLGIPSFIFLGNAKFFPYTIVVSHVWKDVGFSTIIYLAALTGIDPTLYEAAAVDGADRLQRLRHITLPGIAPTIVLIACLGLGGILDAGFDQVLNLYNPAVYATGDILDTYVYRAGLISARYSLAAAVGLFKSGVGFILISVAYWMASKFASYRVF